MYTRYGYEVREKLHASGNKTVLRVQRKSDGLLGVLKFFDTEGRAHAEIERIKNEFNCLKAAKSPHVIVIHDLVFAEHGVGLLLEDFEGESLAELLKQRHKLEVREFLDVAIAITTGLRDIHQQKVIHRDLRPSNVVVNHKTGELKICDFGLLSALSTTPANEQLNALRYISPEQTGKMNRTVDLPSDLYSLGVMFYELLTGHCPFVSDDPLELVHWHIAKSPSPPSDEDPSVPLFLSAVVLKLLKKEAEGRYHGAAGVLADLELARSYVERGQDIPSKLAVGSKDQQQTFRIPERLYGRQPEIQRLLNTFSRAAAGQFEPILVAGYSGIGKSSLINEVQKPLVAARGFFAAGKYDQYNKAKPYSAIQQALGEMVRIVLRQPEDEIKRWREDILQALAGEGQCVVEVVPMLATLIGPQPELPDAGPVSRQNRFNRNCDALLRVFATAEHPLVLFLDDVQWADSASLELVRSWLVKEIPYAMLILAYRDNEVGPHHPLSLMLHDSLGDRQERCRIQLASIGQQYVEELIADTLQPCVSDVRELSAVHMAKTGGNPFFLIQMFRGLHQEGLISFGADGWRWNIQDITARDLTDNVVELMTRKLHRYPAETGSAMNMCAILGAEFSLHTLAIALQTSDEAAYRAVLPAVDDGLLLEGGGRLKFAHDKIHEASYGLVDEAERKRRHRLVGRHLLETLDQEAVENQLFKIVDDLNRSRELLETPAERKALIGLNIRAGQKALAASAFRPSLELFEVATSLLPADAWRTEKDIAYEAWFGVASANYACARFDACEKTAHILLENERDPVRNAPAVQLLVGALFGQTRHEECLIEGLKWLRELGAPLPAKPTKAHVVWAHLGFKRLQGFRSTPSLAELPPATDARAIAALRVLNAIMPPAYVTNLNLMALAALKMAQLSVQYGNTVFAPYAYGILACTEAGVFKAVRSGHAYMRLAFDLLEKYPNAQVHGQIEMFRSSVLRHQVEPIDGWERETMASAALSLDAGTLIYADYSLSFTRTHSLFFGVRSYDEVYGSETEVLGLHRKNGDQVLIENQLYILQVLSRWRDAKNSCGEEIEPQVQSFDVEAHARRLSKPGSAITPRAYLAIVRQIEQFLDGRYAESVRTGLSFVLPALDLVGVMSEHLHRFFFMLAYLASDPKSMRLRDRVLGYLYHLVNRLVFKIYDRNAPNWRSHVALINAEEERRAGRLQEAQRWYERAAVEARNVTLFNEALAYRRLADLLRSQGLSLQSQLMARSAWMAYQRLSFRSELQRLEREYPELTTGALEFRAASSGALSSSGGASSSFNQRLDVESLARGAQAISSQVRLEELVEALLKQLCQSSAAQRVVLFLQEGSALHVQGEMLVSGPEVQMTVLQNLPFPPRRGGSCPVPESLVQFVARVKRMEVLGHAARDGDFTQDPYIKERELKSALCMPILNQGKLLGVLYLENDLAAHAFTKEHQEVLEILASQAAISIENARLYRNLEQKVEERTAELRRKTNDLNSMLQNLEQGVFTILQDGTIHREYSRQLESILGTRAIAGRNFMPLLFSDTSLSPDTISMVQAAVSFSVGSDVLWYESNRHLLVREMQRRRPDGRLTTLELNWSPIVTDEDVVEKVLVSIKDVTELRLLELQAQEQRRDLEMIGQILALPRSVFLEFLRDSDDLLERSARALTAGLDAEGLGLLFRSMHTIKGNGRTYGFDALVRAAHDAEETYAAARTAAQDDWDVARMQRELGAVRDSLQQYRRVYQHNLEAFAGGAGPLTPVDASLLDQIRHAALDAGAEQLSSLLEAIDSSSIEQIVGGLATGVRDLARRLGKPAPQLRSASAGVRFRPEIAPVLRDVFMHVVRNAVDHGLETAAERGAAGKGEYGEITIIARPDQDGAEIVIKDDGRGLATDKLRALASQAGSPAASDEELAELPFCAGLSTADSVTDVSGRGVGMDAVRRMVAERGGRVWIELGPDAGGTHRPFSLRMTLPRRCVVLLSSTEGSDQTKLVRADASARVA